MTATDRRPAAGLVRRLGWPDAVTAALTLGALAATFAPWARSGERARTSYELVEVAKEAGIVTSLEPLMRAWYLVPLGCGVVFLCGFFTARRAAGLALATVGAAIAWFSYLVIRSPLLPTGGCRIALLLGTACALWSVGLLVRPRTIGTS